MATYWKSTGKWYCEICKCWTGDNKASIEFHERGKRHAENKRKKILEIKRDAMGKREKDKKEDAMFAKMEKDALAAVQKDIAGGNVGRSDMRKIISAHSDIPRDSEAIDPYPWSAMTAPQGFTYYYNSITGESTWVVPEVFKKIEEQKKKKENEAHASNSHENIEEKKKEEQAKAEDEDGPVQERDVHPLLVGWSTVSSNVVETKEIPLPVDTPVEEVAETPEEGKSEQTEVVRESGRKFKEKVLTTHLTSESEPVAFKKRKGAQRNVRKRNEDDD